MKWCNSRVLFNVNQEMTSLFTNAKSLHSQLEIFTIEKIDQNPRIAPSVGSLNKNSFSGYSPISASPSTRHFSILKSTISTAFPDYDFTDLSLGDFRRVIQPDQIRSNIGWQLSSALPSSDVLESHLWQAIESEISPAFSDIYRYEPDSADVFSEMGAIWSYTYFFINEKMKKVLLLHLRDGADNFGSDASGDDTFCDDCELLENRFGFGVF